MVLGLVVVAGLVGDAVTVGILPHWQVVAPLAGASLTAVDDVLHGQQGGGPHPLPFDVDPICKAVPRKVSTHLVLPAAPAAACPC